MKYPTRESNLEDNRNRTLEDDAMEEVTLDKLIWFVAITIGLTVLVLAIVQTKERIKNVRQCLHCRKEIHKDATICPHCRTTFKSDNDKLPPSL